VRYNQIIVTRSQRADDSHWAELDFLRLVKIIGTERGRGNHINQDCKQNRVQEEITNEDGARRSNLELTQLQNGEISANTPY